MKTSAKIISLLIVTLSIYVIMLSVTIPELMEYSGGLKILDMMPTGYDAAYVQMLFDALGDRGREVYLTRQLVLDAIYPALFIVTYGYLLFILCGKILSDSRMIKFIVAFPIIAGTFDYLENIGIVSMLLLYPSRIVTLVSITSVFTIIKSLFGIFTFVSIIF